MEDNSSINRYFFEIQNYFEVLKILNFQKPLNLLMKISNGYIFLKKVTSSKFRFRRIRTVVAHWDGTRGTSFFIFSLV